MCRLHDRRPFPAPGGLLFTWVNSQLDNLPPRTRKFSLYGVGAALLLGVISATGGKRAPTVTLDPVMVAAIPTNMVLEQLLSDSLLGRSGKLRARFVPRPLVLSYPMVSATLGEKPGITPVNIPDDKGIFSFISLVPFVEKYGDRVGTYLVGYWPGELRTILDDDYRNPVGFVQVTQENETTRVSEHFTLRDFITKDRQLSWPRYIVLQEPLLDKLELVIADLKRNGIPVNHVRVLSGFRTPYHNLYGVGSEGGARDSRHQYGDAADIIIDNDRNGKMDDLNGDRRVDTRDLNLVLAAVERVERAHPELVGGLGKYHAIGPSGPFAHIDVRGHRARWNNEARPTVIAQGAGVRGAYKAPQAGRAVKMSRCTASAEFAALCGG